MIATFTRATIPFLLLAGALTFVGPHGRERDLVVLPFAPDRIRDAIRVEASVLLCNARSDEEIEVVAVRVRAGDVLLHERALGTALSPDPDYLRANEIIELLPAELTDLHRDRRYFADPDSAPLAGPEVSVRQAEVAELLGRVRGRNAANPSRRSFIEPDVPLSLDLLFAPDDPSGKTVDLVFEVDYRTERGALRTASATTRMEWLGPHRGLPAHLVGSGKHVHAGDLHVHSCHGEAANACSPSTDCATEQFQTSGSFSYAQLKTHYESLGMDWFAATDHSFCINDTSEFQTIQSELAAISDSSFVTFADIELSSAERGAQKGDDLSNIVCAGGQPQNHMGAHGITSRIPGGTDILFGYCNGIDGFRSNLAAVRSQGGFSIAHHPTALSFAWNSIEATNGIEKDGLHGVEVWHGPFQSGQDGNVGRWVEWLLGGRVLYAYSGSDTHDAAYGFGANHIVLESNESFTQANVKKALMEGRVYLSNGPALLLEADVLGKTYDMGTLEPLRPGSTPLPVTLRAHYDFGTDTGAVIVLGGVAGLVGEGSLGQVAGLTGAGFVEFHDLLVGPDRRWYRAYAQNDDNTETAYTNPIFFEFPRSLEVDEGDITLSGGGLIVLELSAGSQRGGEFYRMLGSASGTSPGFDLQGLHVPLVQDAYFAATLKVGNPAFHGFFGVLDDDGRASASISVPAGAPPSLAGITLHHAFVGVSLPATATFVSNAVPVTLKP